MSKDFIGWLRCLDRNVQDRNQGLFGLLEDVRAGRTVFADDVFLCRLHERIIFETLLAPFVRPGYNVRWVYFANDPATCRRNVELRNRQQPDAKRLSDSLQWIEKLPPLYQIPREAEVLPVVDYGARS